MRRMVKFNKWSVRDAYRAPIAYLVLWPLIAHNYAMREAGEYRDKWYMPDALAYRWGYAVAFV